MPARPGPTYATQPPRSITITNRSPVACLIAAPPGPALLASVLLDDPKDRSIYGANAAPRQFVWSGRSPRTRSRLWNGDRRTKEDPIMRLGRTMALLLLLGLLPGLVSTVSAAGPADPDQAAYDLTPPRLSLTDGQVSFWRPGADDWTTALVNTPLAPGDEVSTASPGNLEIQIGQYSFVRGWANTQIGLENQEPNFIQFKVTDGSAAFDLRRLEPGRTVEVDTPNAAFSITQPGYYRVDVTGDRTSFITRRAGRATAIPAGADPLVITSSEEVVIDGVSAAKVASFVAPPLDEWDQWNYGRTDRLQDAVSGRYLASDIYGESDLDRYGTWRVVPTYGSIWVPTALPSGWTPYSSGSWIRDPYYGWTWVDSATWGWAPYHYGRWVFVDGFWAWAPGPVVTRPPYSPALVAFFGGPVGGGPVVGWVALGWGEPVVPWWGRSGFIHEPSWRGWGGPRVVNNVVVNNTVVNVQNINVYRNADVKNAVVVVNENRFGHGPISGAREQRVDARSLRPIHEAPPVAVTPASLAPAASRGVRPPAATLGRSVVATRPPRVVPAAAEPSGGARNVSAPAPRIVTPAPAREASSVPARPPFGQSTIERPVTTVRTQPPPPPREAGQRSARGTPASGTAAPGTEAAGRATPPPSRRVEAPPATAPAPPTTEAPARATPPPSRRVETPPATAPAPPTAEAPARATPPPSRVESTQATPSPQPQAPPRRVAPPQATHQEVSTQPPARRLPGEPANRLSPTRGEPPPQQRPDR